VPLKFEIKEERYSRMARLSNTRYSAKGCNREVEITAISVYGFAADRFKRMGVREGVENIF